MSTEAEAFAVTASVPGWGSGLDLAAKDFVLFSLVSRCCMGQLFELSLQHFPGFPLKYLLLYSNTFSEYLDLTHTWSLSIFNTWKSIAISKVSQAGSPGLSHSAALLPGYAADGGERCRSCLLGANNGMRWHLQYTDPVNLCADVHGLGGCRCPDGDLGLCVCCQNLLSVLCSVCNVEAESSSKKPLPRFGLGLCLSYVFFCNWMHGPLCTASYLTILAVILNERLEVIWYPWFECSHAIAKKLVKWKWNSLQQQFFPGLFVSSRSLCISSWTGSMQN